jgi:hypothetical protein
LRRGGLATSQPALHYLASRAIEAAMLPRRCSALLVLAALAGCASAHVQRGAPPSEISLDLSASPSAARQRLAAAFAAHGLTVGSSQPGVIEFRAPRERGVLGYYEVFARAVIVPLDCGTRITMFGEETHYPSATSSDGTATRIGPSSTGRAGDVWSNLEAVASGLRADSSAIRVHNEQ